LGPGATLSGAGELGRGSFCFAKFMEAYEIFKTVVPIEPKSDLTPNK
jgi:hypothetical protein